MTQNWNVFHYCGKASGNDTVMEKKKGGESKRANRKRCRKKLLPFSLPLNIDLTEWEKGDSDMGDKLHQKCFPSSPPRSKGRDILAPRDAQRENHKTLPILFSFLGEKWKDFFTDMKGWGKMGTVLVVACPCSKGRGETHSFGSASETNPLKSYVCDPLWSTMLLCSHREGKERKGPTIFFLCLCSRHRMEREKLQFGLVTSREWHGEGIAHHFPL